MAKLTRTSHISEARVAFDAGKTRYFTGKACKYGHIAERMISNGMCVTCLNAKHKENYIKVKEWRKANPEKVAEQAKRYAAKHPETNKRAQEKHRAEHIEEIRAYDRAYKARMRAINPDREKARLARFAAKKERQLSEIAGRPRPQLCEICGELNLRIVFDHCHTSGKFRGWLCDRCNKVLGLVYDSPELLMKLRDYLKGVAYGETHQQAEKQTA